MKMIKRLTNKVFNGNRKFLKKKSDLEIKEYLLYEISELKRRVRFLIAETDYYSSVIAQTKNSFDYQWGHVTEGENLLSNPKFVENVQDLIELYTQLPKEWFQGKKVLDAGSGNGRFSYGLASLGADVSCIDQSSNGIENVMKIANDNNFSINFQKQDLLKSFDLANEFDLVWSYGVLHHTGNTYQAFKNIIPFVKKGGYIFLMLYGEPRPGHPKDITELYNYERLRRKVANKDFKEKVAILECESVVDDVHGWFDAVSPLINDLYSFEEVEGWLIADGFDDVIRTFENRNLHMIARKNAE